MVLKFYLKQKKAYRLNGKPLLENFYKIFNLIL